MPPWIALFRFSSPVIDETVNIPVTNRTDNTVPKALDLNSLSPKLGSTGSHKSEAGAHLQNTLKNWQLSESYQPKGFRSLEKSIYGKKFLTNLHMSTSVPGATSSVLTKRSTNPRTLLQRQIRENQSLGCQDELWLDNCYKFHLTLIGFSIVVVGTHSHEWTIRKGINN